jgi:hypothetical protein
VYAVESKSETKVFIRIMNLSPTLFQIEPISVGKKTYSEKDLSIELRCLKQQLKTYGLIEDEDYVINNGEYPRTSPEYKVKFQGKSLVIRALFAIPSDLIQFSVNHYDTPTNSGDLEKIKNKYAVTLPQKQCFYPEVKWVKEAQLQVFTNLKGEIKALHKAFINITSSVINQLDSDIEILSERTDPLFDNTNLSVLVSALQNAYNEEKSKPTVLPNSLFNFFSKESLILADYEKIIKKYAINTPQLYNLESSYNPKPILEKIQACYQQIGSKTGESFGIDCKK